MMVWIDMLELLGIVKEFGFHLSARKNPFVIFEEVCLFVSFSEIEICFPNFQHKLRQLK